MAAFARKVVLQGVGLCFVSTLSVAGLLLALFPLWAPLFHLEQYFYATVLFILACAVHFTAELLGLSLAALLLYKYIVAANVIRCVVRTVVIVLVLVQGSGLFGVIVAEACGYLSLCMATAVFYYIGSVRRETNTEIEKAPADIYPRMRRYGIFHVINVSGMRIIGTETDILAVSLFFPGPLVGLYALAVRVVNSLENILPFRTLDDVIGPVFFRQYARSKNPGTLQAMVSFLTKVSALVLLPVVVTMLALGDILLGTVFGRQYHDMYGLTSILSIALLFNLMRIPLSLVLLALERNDIISLTRLAALYNLLGYVLFAPVFGIYGIAVATCSAAILQSVLLYYFGVKLSGVHLEWKAQGVILARFGLLGLFLVFCRYLNESLLVLVPAAVVAGTVTLWLCWSHGVFHASERQLV
ncbi:MAG TPA: oligosaccharide flippase family protein, partial [Candidatus Saccharimonadales bacterium]|nr:oligosaccharide flippase family protein [Candidatus Saccharimonadales bacterium]